MKVYCFWERDPDAYAINAVGTQTISRWLKSLMRMAGVEEEFKAHSTRHAATSRALSKGLDLSSIRKAAGWSKDTRVFARFHNRPVNEAE